MSSLNSEQTEALQMALNGHNFVLMGAAGTGKSTVVSAIVEACRDAGKKVRLTCSTGIACLVYARKLQATTVHKFTGIEDGRHDPSEIGPSILNSPFHADVLKRVRETDILIIDECSMISARTFSLISEVLALNDLSVMFGGIQVILVGDFHQLPPVKDALYGDEGAYCFESERFDSLFPHHIVLSDIVRQSDQHLVKAIQEVAGGNVSGETIDYIRSYDRDVGSDFEVPVHLFARNEYVDDFNRKHILDFPGPLYEFASEDDGDDKRRLEKLPVPKKLWLKIGIPVILLRNLSDILVNGLRGIVYEIDDQGPTVEFKEAGITTRLEKLNFEVYSPTQKRNIAVRKQFPVKPAFGLTIHKAQGMTLDRVHIDCRDIFQAGQLGVALSRVRTPEGLSVTNFQPKHCIVPPVVVVQFLSRKSRELCEDRSCCRNCRRNESQPDSQTSDGDADHLQVNVEDLDPDHEEEHEDFDEEFDDLIRDINSDVSNIVLPDDFNFFDIIESLKVKNAVRESDKNTNIILETMPLGCAEQFCKQEFLAISAILKTLNITEPRAVPSKELSAFYTKIKSHLSSLDYKMKCLDMFNFTNEPFSDDNMHICFNLHIAVRKYLMKQQTNLYQYEHQNLIKRFLTTESNARIRYVGGYCVAKLRNSYCKKKNTHRFSVSSSSQQIYEECDFSLTILNLMKEEETIVKANTTVEASLTDVDRRQNISRGLTSIPDDIFFFFTKLCGACLNMLTSAHLNQYGEEMFTYCFNQLLSNKDLTMDFMNKISHHLSESNVKTDAAMKITHNPDLKDKYIKKIFSEVVKKFLMVLFAQFRRDLKSSFHVEKTLAHRKQIQVSKEKKSKHPGSSCQTSSKPKSTKRNKAQSEDLSQSVSDVTEEPSVPIHPTSITLGEPCTTDNDVLQPEQSTSRQLPKGKQSKRKGRKQKQTQKSKTVPSESYMDETGEMVWICPPCKQPDNGIDHMIGCDICEEWFHWKCVGVTKEPEEDMWFCPACDPHSTGKGKGKRKGRKRKERN